MKHILLFLALNSFLVVQAQFDAHVMVDSNVYSSSIDIVDMNGDGYNDLVVTQSSGGGNVSIYLNDSTGSFGMKSIISSSNKQYLTSATGDFDKDGRNDIVAISRLGGKLTRFLQSSAGQYTETEFFTGIFFPLDVRSADFDQDGYMDLVSLGDRSIYAHMNDQSGDFDSTDVASYTEFYAICVGDLNNDDYPDLIGANGKFYTFMNDGSGSLVRDSTNDFTASGGLIHELELADMDGDNDLDVLVYYTNVSDKVDWYSNDGNGVLTKESTITSLANNIVDIGFGDINRDGLIDLALAYDQTQTLVWIENLGGGNFATEDTISGGIYSTQVELGDLDNDGDLELVHNTSSEVFFYNNITPVPSSSFDDLGHQELSWYPNPSQGTIQIQLQEHSTISILDSQGRLVLQRLLPAGPFQLESSLPSGNYVLEIASTQGTQRSKLILVD